MSRPLHYSDLYYEYLHSLLPFNISKHYCHLYEAAERLLCPGVSMWTESHKT